MFSTRLKVMAVLLLVTLVGAGVGFFTYRKFVDQPGPTVSNVLLGINNDEERAKAKEVVQKDRMTWPSWWDGDINHGGPIATRWNVSSWPTVYLLDHKGNIRYKNISDKETGCSHRHFASRV